MILKGIDQARVGPPFDLAVELERMSYPTA